jgi:hypothetical protein
MKLFRFIPLLALSATLTGCFVGGGTTVVYPHKKKTVVYEQPAEKTTVVVQETTPQSQPTVIVEEEVVVYEETTILVTEPTYYDHCDYYGDEECCYDYDWQIVWVNSHSYVHEVCEYTSCLDYWTGYGYDDINCWYE